MSWIVRGVVCATLLGCGSGPKAEQKPAAHDSGTAAAPVPAPLPAAPVPSKPKPPRSVRVKAVNPPDGEVVAGARLHAPHAFNVPDGGELTLDFERGARVHVLGAAQVLVDLADLDQLLVRSGLVSVDLSPSAPTPQSGFKLITPAGQLSLLRGGRFVARVFDDTTHANVVSGALTLSAAHSATVPEGDKVLLAAGDGFIAKVDVRLQRLPHKLPTLEAAEAAALKLRAPKRTDAPIGPRLDRLVEAALAELAPHLTRQDALLAQHRALVQARDADTLAVQAELAENAAKVAEARARLRTALGQRAAALQTPASGADDALSQKARAQLTH